MITDQRKNELEAEAFRKKIAELEHIILELKSELEGTRVAEETYRKMYWDLTRGENASEFGKEVGKRLADWGDKMMAEGLAELEAIRSK